jgi:aldose 1-epimerase
MESLTFGDGPLKVVVLADAGARLHRISAFGHELLRTPADERLHLTDPFFWGGYVMAPWCNRIEPGPTRVGSRLVALESNFPDGTAIHGQVASQPWQVQGDRSFKLRGGGDGWPWRYELSERVSVLDSRLRIELALTNVDDGPMPAGIGIHPWFRTPDMVAIHGEQIFVDNGRSDAAPQPVAGPLDLRSMRAIPDDIDATWTDLSDPAAELLWREQVRATMRIEADHAFVVAASPKHFGAIAVEPQTHAPHGLGRLLNGGPGALSMVAPGATLSLVINLDFQQLASRGHRRTPAR